jgi:hypothetical protein
MAIVSSGAASAFQKALNRPAKAQKQSYRKKITFNIQEISYDRLIQTMNENTTKNTLFSIYHPDSRITVGATLVVAQ